MIPKIGLRVRLVLHPLVSEQKVTTACVGYQPTSFFPKMHCLIGDQGALFDLRTDHVGLVEKCHESIDICLSSCFHVYLQSIQCNPVDFTSVFRARYAECISICIYPLWGSLHVLGTQKGTQKTAVQTRYCSRIECAPDTRPATILPGMESHYAGLRQHTPAIVRPICIDPFAGDQCGMACLDQGSF